MAISSPGVGSNLPIDDLISKLMAAESKPLTLLAQKESAYKTKLSAYSSLSGAVSTFQSAMANLGKASTFESLKTTIGDSTIFSAAATTKAIGGTYQVNVTQLAQAQSLSTAGQIGKTTTIGSGATSNISFQFGTISGGALVNGKYTDAVFTQDADQATGSITIDNSNNSLQGIRDAINAANIGVTATLVSDGSATPDKLVLTSTKTGEKSSMKITVDGDATLQELLEYDPAGTQRLIQNGAAQNTQLTVNGLAINSATNTVEEAIQGVTLNIAKTGSTSLTIAKDTSAVESNVSAFIKAYNDLNSALKNLTSYTPAKVQGQAGTGGPLVGDATARSIQEQVRKMLTTSLEGLSNSSMSLSKIGVAFQKDGSLALDSEKLKKAMADNFSDISGLFATVGKPSDSLINFTTSTAATKAGSYAIEITKLATQAQMKGNVDLRANLTQISPGTSLNVKVDGVEAKIMLNEGSYTSEDLASMVQSAINGASELKAVGSSVSATIDNNGNLALVSNRYGSASNLTVNSATGTPASALFGSVTIGTDGEDVVGKINGEIAVGSGQFLTGAKGSAIEGLKLEILGGALGARGRIDFSQGYADRLSKLAESFIGEEGLISSRTNGINASIKDLTDQADAMELKLTAIENRYRAQFTALDVLIAKMNTTSSFLTQQLAQIASLSSQ